MSSEEQAKRFINTLKDLGGSAGNGSLSAELGWADSTYQRIKARLIEEGRLMQRMEDTERALGSDVMAAALEVYGVLKVAGKDKGVDDARNELAARFVRRGYGKKPDPRTAPAA